MAETLRDASEDARRALADARRVADSDPSVAHLQALHAADVEHRRILSGMRAKGHESQLLRQTRADTLLDRVLLLEELLADGAGIVHGLGDQDEDVADAAIEELRDWAGRASREARP